MSLVNYSSSSSSESENSADDSNDEVSLSDESNPKKRRFDATAYETVKQTLLPNALKILGLPKGSAEEIIDDPSKHDGRVRAFKHERGNWVTYVYIPVDLSLFEDTQELCQNALANIVDLRLPNDELHISISKTVILQYHLIDSFVQTLGSEFAPFRSFGLSFKELKVYTNEEKTRTFIALKVDDLYFEMVHELMKKVDKVMLEFKQPLFYEDPSFHVSFLWCLGDKVDILHKHLNDIAAKLVQQNVNSSFIVDVKQILCTSGNKQFAFKLQK